MKAEARLKEVFGDALIYRDVSGLCKTATLAEIAKHRLVTQPWPLRGVAPGEDVSDEDFKVQAEALNGELESLSVQAENWSRSSPRM